MSAPIQTIELQANQLTFIARSCGEGPLALCLHGFPDSAHTWDELLPRLAAAGYRAVAPFMRGYAPTAVPADERYDAGMLAQDVLALARQLSDAPCVLVGHDWGAVTAYAAAIADPARIHAFVAAAVPPTSVFLANMNIAQLRRSWYMLFFQCHGLAERRLAANDMALVERLWRDWSPGWAFTSDDIAPAKQALAHPAARRAALGYYRALLPLLLNTRRRGQMMSARISVPGRLIYGQQDGCIGAELFAHSTDCFDVPSDLQAMAAGHFMHRERPERFAELVLDWFDKHANTTNARI